ncbi:MAG: hypothetical protein KC457_14505 [Myxococcales bacterium]|nr:hypothetical protein [Myxococcales bacterium]
MLLAVSTDNVEQAPCATELAACIRLLAEGAPLAALVRVVFSPLSSYRELPTSFIDALVDELARQRAPEWTALALAQADAPDDRRTIEALETLEDLEPGDLGTVEALESHLFDLASEIEDAGWYGLSAWVASRQAEREFEDETIQQFGRSALDMAPDLPLSHALWIRTLLNLDDDAGAAQAFREALLSHENDPQWVWALLRSTSVDGNFPELHQRAYALLDEAFANDEAALRAVAKHRARLADDELDLSPPPRAQATASKVGEPGKLSAAMLISLAGALAFGGYVALIAGRALWNFSQYGLPSTGPLASSPFTTLGLLGAMVIDAAMAALALPWMLRRDPRLPTLMVAFFSVQALFWLRVLTLFSGLDHEIPDTVSAAEYTLVQLLFPLRCFVWIAYYRNPLCQQG